MGNDPDIGTPDATTAVAPLAIADTVSTDEQVTSDDVAPSATLSFAERYHTRAQLGAGGMGVVHATFDRRIGREVALKKVGAGGDTVRFWREARVQGQLEHPSVAPVYDLGVDEEGALWFTMKRVRGMTLAQVLRGLASGDAALSARYTRRKLLSALCSVCMAVDYAHSRGVLHRDLKPSNIMLGEFGEVHLLDWGVARIGATDEPALPLTDETGQTQAGTVIGTPGYMSPEQAAGRVDRLDGRTDVFALGAILFEIITLTPLVAPDAPMRMLAATLSGVDARASSRAPSADVPPELEDLCLRATAIDPDARLASARELCDAIERYLDGDRDVERRRTLAQQHLAAGARALERAASPGAVGIEARVEAMRELTRALAFDPDNAEAASQLARLMMTPPAETPPEVEARIDELRQRERRNGVRLSIFSNLAWIAFAPALFLMGMRSVRLFAVSAVLLVGVTLYAFSQLRGARLTERRGLGQVALMAVMVATLSTLFGSLVLVPTLALAVSIFFVLLGGAPRLGTTIAITMPFMVIVPALLAWSGVLPDPYSFEGSQWVIHAQMVRLPPTVTPLLLLTADALVISVAVLLVHRSRQAIASIERRLLVNAWHLEKLVARSC